MMRKDSLEITDDDRRSVADRILSSSARRVIVTHGTDTMAETARVVADALRDAESPTTVVFVGSLSPGAV